MRDWRNFFSEINLNAREKQVANRFLKNTKGRFFLPASELLKRKGFPHEAFEMLTWGLQFNQDYQAARVTLAKEFYDRGMIEDCSDLLQDTQTSLKGNVLAQNLLFYNAVIAQYETYAKSIYQHMEYFHMLDEKTRTLGKILKYQGINECRKKILADFKEKNIPVILPIKKSAFSLKSSNKGNETKNSKLVGTHAKEGVKGQKSLLFRKSAFSSPELEQFFVVPLNEIFKNRLPERKDGEEKTLPSSLDLPTLAEIYKKQGHLEKSLEIFNHLLETAPNNEYYKRSRSQLHREMRRQERKELTPEQNEVKNAKTSSRSFKSNFYHSLLEKLHDEPINS